MLKVTIDKIEFEKPSYIAEDSYKVTAMITVYCDLIDKEYLIGMVGEVDDYQMEIERVSNYLGELKPNADLLTALLSLEDEIREKQYFDKCDREAVHADYLCDRMREEGY